jgi:hypothetical protein
VTVTTLAPSLLAEALGHIAREVDSGFDALLPVPEDSRRPLVEAMRHAAIGGGKRLRPLLLTATAAMYGVDRQHALRAALAIEAVHAYSLIHDDLPCMDDGELRHGKPALHRAFDEATAVLAGDALLTMAFEILADHATSGDPFVRIELVQTLAQASGSAGMVGGQTMDIAAEGQALDLPAITRLQQLKTGALLGAAVEMGAILGRRRAARTCADLPAMPGWPFRSPTTCSTLRAMPLRPARRCVRTKRRARRPSPRCSAHNVRANRRGCWSTRQLRISPSTGRKPNSCALWRTLLWRGTTDGDPHRDIPRHV